MARFEVEQAVMIAWDLPVVLVRLVSGAVASPAGGGRLAGCPVREMKAVEASVRADGTPRVNLFTVALEYEEDLRHFLPGQIVLLEPAM